MSYETDNFLTKNRDFVVAEHQLLLEASSQPYVAQLFPPDRDDGDQVRPHPTWTSALLPRPARALPTGKAEHHRLRPSRLHHYVARTGAVVDYTYFICILFNFSCPACAYPACLRLE